MAIIVVPKPSKEAWNPSRSVNGLLLAQVEHLQRAEAPLPLRYRSGIYTRAIRTEGEAAQYIHEATEAIHKAHADAMAQRAGRAHQRKGHSKGNARSKKRGRRK